MVYSWYRYQMGRFIARSAIRLALLLQRLPVSGFQLVQLTLSQHPTDAAGALRSLLCLSDADAAAIPAAFQALLSLRPHQAQPGGREGGGCELEQ